MSLICIPGDKEIAIPFLTTLLHRLLEDEFGQATREELETEVTRQFEENGAEENDARVLWLRNRIAALDTRG